MMGCTLMEELAVMQADMVSMEGMVEMLIKGAHSGTRTEYIGNSLEILRDYLSQRADKLDRLIQVPKEGGACI